MKKGRCGARSIYEKRLSSGGAKTEDVHIPSFNSVFSLQRLNLRRRQWPKKSREATGKADFEVRGAGFTPGEPYEVWVEIGGEVFYPANRGGGDMTVNENGAISSTWRGSTKRRKTGLLDSLGLLTIVARDATGLQAAAALNVVASEG